MNGWAESTPISQHSPIQDFSQRAVAFGMHSIEVDGQDVEEVYAATREAREYAASGHGPVFLNVRTYRLVGHYIGDPQVYRTKEEIEELRNTKDPIELLRAQLELSDEEFEALDTEATRSSSRSAREGGTDPKPEDAPRVRLCLRSPTVKRFATRRARCARTTTSSSWARTSPRWVASMGVTQGMLEELGPARSQHADLGDRDRGNRYRRRNAGDAPGREIMYQDFLTLMEQLVNQAAKHRTTSGGQ